MQGHHTKLNQNKKQKGQNCRQSVVVDRHSYSVMMYTQDRESPEVRSRLDSVERRYHELLELTELRKQRLLDALALYKLYNDADGVEQWIAEKACCFTVFLVTVYVLPDCGFCRTVLCINTAYAVMRCLPGWLSCSFIV